MNTADKCSAVCTKHMGCC